MENRPPLVLPSSDGENLFAEERRARIVETVQRAGKVTVAELCAALGVTGATIRHDLRHLESIGALGRTHGGAIRPTSTGFETAFEQRRAANRPAKMAISQAALDLVDDGDCLLLDTGTTTYELAKLLGQKRNITIVTNDIVIAMAVEEFPHAQVVLLGGTLRRGFHCTLGFDTTDPFRSLSVDKAFMGTNSFSLAHGASTPDLLQAHAKSAMIKAAQRVILLCDHTKFSHVSFARFATLRQINTLVTDALPAAWHKPLRKLGVDVVIARAQP